MLSFLNFKIKSLELSSRQRRFCSNVIAQYAVQHAAHFRLFLKYFTAQHLKLTAWLTFYGISLHTIVIHLRSTEITFFISLFNRLLLSNRAPKSISTNYLVNLKRICKIRAKDFVIRETRSKIYCQLSPLTRTRHIETID